MKVKNLTNDLEAAKTKISKCEQNYELCTRNYNSIINTNNDMRNSLTACQKELKISKNSFAKAEKINKQFDEEIIIQSVKKTGRLVIADGAWKTGSFAAEIATSVAEKTFNYLKAPIKRVCLPDCPAPASSSLEKVYYPTHSDIIKCIKSIL